MARAHGVNRRQFIGRVAVMGASGLIALRSRRAAAEPAPETPRIRLSHIPGICVAPQYVAEGLLRAEGFTDVQYVKRPTYDAFAAGEVDVSMAFVAPFVIQVDTGLPVVMLAGVHVGCFELFGAEPIGSIRELKGKRVAVPGKHFAHYFFLAAMMTYVGLDPERDIQWAIHPVSDSARLLTERQVDAVIGFPPVPQELRARKIGHVIVNSGIDRPWSQYLCCVVTAQREFVRRYPVATKRAVRAFLKATDLCALDSDRAARIMVDRGFTPRLEYAQQAMKEIPYGRWREYDPEDSVRFYALRLREANMIKATPQRIIADGTDWRILTELRRELKS